MISKATALFSAILLSSVSSFAAGQTLTINCFDTSDTGHTNSQFTMSVDTSSGELSLDDGAELSGDYHSDKAKDTTGYSAFKIYGASQDGEQPNEAKISNVLLSGPGQTAPVWLAPGIQGGSFDCVSSL